jgi:hypothetical protein
MLGLLTPSLKKALALLKAFVFFFRYQVIVPIHSYFYQAAYILISLGLCLLQMKWIHLKMKMIFV